MTILLSFLSFAPIWILLCILEAISLLRVLRTGAERNKRMWFFTLGTQLVLAVLWAFLFFSLHDLTLPVVVAIVLWFATLVLAFGSWDIDRASFWLLLPCLAWITFTMILTAAFWWMN